VDVLLVGVCKRVEVVVVVLIYLFRLAVELEDANIRVVIVVVEHVKRVDMDANALASVPEDASVLPVLAAQVKDSAALNDAVVANANARVYK
jgi:hypothetical protein